jgi:hypothetical protein
MINIFGAFASLIEDPGTLSSTDSEEQAEAIRRVWINIFGLDDDRLERLKGIFCKNEQLSKNLHIIYNFLFLYVFGFVKGFDSTLAEDDPNNYYMEREWRVIGNIKFALTDIERVIFPRDYASRFRKDFPDYAGEVFFADGS